MCYLALYLTGVLVLEATKAIESITAFCFICLTLTTASTISDAQVLCSPYLNGQRLDLHEMYLVQCSK